MLKCDLGKTEKTLDICSLGRVMTQDIKMLTTSKKVPAPSLDKIKLSSVMTEFFSFTLTKNKTRTFGKKILENNNDSCNEQHGF